MRRLSISVLMIMLCSAVLAVEWANLDDAHHLWGEKLSSESLVGKVVLVDMWGINCPPCRKLLPQLEKYYQAYKHKPFTIVGCHCQNATKDEVVSVLKAAGVTYSVYDRFALAENAPAGDGSIPFLYVVDRRGKVIYAGHGEREAIEAAVNAFSSVVGSSLLGGTLPYGNKAYAKKFTLGNNLKSELKKIAKDAANSKSKTAAESQRILQVVRESKAAVVDEIELQSKAKPEEALRLAKLYIKSFPDEANDFKARIDEIQARIKDSKSSKKMK